MDLFTGVVSWIGDYETIIFNDHGGLHKSFNHKVTIIIPPRAVPQGVQGTLVFSATFFAPVEFTPRMIPVSAIVRVEVDVELLKPIKLCMPHFAHVENQSHMNNLFFAKLTHSLVPTKGYMDIIDGGDFKIGKEIGLLNFNDSSYYCIVNSTAVTKDIPKIRYRITIIKYRSAVGDYWNYDVCILPALPTCKKVMYIVSLIQ